MNNNCNPTATHRDDWRDRATVSVEEAGAVLGVGRAAAYRYANSGHLPVLRLGKHFLVPTAKLRQMLGETTNEEVATATNRDDLNKLAAGPGHHAGYGR